MEIYEFGIVPCTSQFFEFNVHWPRFQMVSFDRKLTALQSLLVAGQPCQVQLLLLLRCANLLLLIAKIYGVRSEELALNIRKLAWTSATARTNKRMCSKSNATDLLLVFILYILLRQHDWLYNYILPCCVCLLLQLRLSQTALQVGPFGQPDLCKQRKLHFLGCRVGKYICLIVPTVPWRSAINKSLNADSSLRYLSFTMHSFPWTFLWLSSNQLCGASLSTMQGCRCSRTALQCLPVFTGRTSSFNAETKSCMLLANVRCRFLHFTPTTLSQSQLLLHLLQAFKQVRNAARRIVGNLGKPTRRTRN